MAQCRWRRARDRSNRPRSEACRDLPLPAGRNRPPSAVFASDTRGGRQMRALVWHGKHDIRCDSVPDPRIEHPRDAIIKVTGCAICGSDLHLYDNIMPGMKRGDIMGHETMGEVVEVGAEARGAEGGRPRRHPLHHHLRRVRPVPARQLLGLRAHQPQQGDRRQGVRPHHRGAVRLHPPDRRLSRRPGRVSPRALRRHDAHQGARPGLTDEQVLFLSRHLPDRLAGRGAVRHPADRHGGDLGLRAGRARWRSAAPCCSARSRSSPSTACPSAWPWRGPAARSRSTSSEESVVERLNELTGGKGPEKCIDAVGHRGARHGHARFRL